jgi:hypothetical protein
MLPNPEDPMYIDLTWKIALPALIGLFIIATVVMNSGAIAQSRPDSRGATRSTSTSSVCNVLYPVPCAYVQPW